MSCELLFLTETDVRAATQQEGRLINELRRDAIHLAGAQAHTLPRRRAVDEDAQLHLAEAREFLDAAATNRDLGLDNAAGSDAVISAINSKDAICLAPTGRTGKSDNHTQAVEESKRSGPAGTELTSTPSRLLNLKTRSHTPHVRCRLPMQSRPSNGPAGCARPPNAPCAIGDAPHLVP